MLPNQENLRISLKLSAILKTTKREGEDTKEIATYLDHGTMAVLYSTATIPNIVQNKGAVVGSPEVDCFRNRGNLQL